MSCRQISWSELPQDLLMAIAERLEIRSDIQRFREVCKEWWKTVPFSFLTSKNILSPLFPLSLSTSKSSWLGSSEILVASSVFLLRSALDPKISPWVFTAEEFNPGKLLVKKSLLPIATRKFHPHFPKNLDLSHIQVSELARFYNFRSANHLNKDLPVWYNLANFGNYKVILFVDPNCYKTSCTVIGDCTAMVLHHHGALSAIRLSNEQELHINFKGRKLDDIANFKGMIYAVDRKGRVYHMGYDTLSMLILVEEPLAKILNGKNKRLAVSRDNQELYLIYRWCRKENRDVSFKLYKLNEEQRKWDEVEGIGDDRILFVTFDGCFFASTKDFPGWGGNCMVFYRACFTSYSGSSDIHNHYRSLSVFYFNGGYCLNLASYQSNVFSPPPAWLSLNSNTLLFQCHCI